MKCNLCLFFCFVKHCHLEIGKRVINVIRIIIIEGYYYPFLGRDLILRRLCSRLPCLTSLCRHAHTQTHTHEIIYIYIYIPKLVGSRILSVTICSSNIDMEFIASIENAEVSTKSDRH